MTGPNPKSFWFKFSWVYVVFFKSSLGVSKVQPALKTTDSNNKQTDNKVLGIILTYLLCKNTKGNGPNDYFWIALKGGVALYGWMDRTEIPSERSHAKSEGIASARPLGEHQADQ